jgi:hypothetical protein
LLLDLKDTRLAQKVKKQMARLPADHQRKQVALPEGEK